AQHLGNDRGSPAAAFLVLGQGKYGHDWAKQSGRRPEAVPPQWPSSLAGVVVCPHHFSGRFSESAECAFSMGVGLLQLQQRRAADYAQFPSRTATAGMKRVSD